MEIKLCDFCKSPIGEKESLIPIKTEKYLNENGEECKKLIIYEDHDNCSGFIKINYYEKKEKKEFSVPLYHLINPFQTVDSTTEKDVCIKCVTKMLIDYINDKYPVT